MIRRLKHLGLIVIGAAAFACTEQVSDEAHEHASEVIMLEGDEVTRALETRLGSGSAFVRLAVLFDAADPNTLELRASSDGETWSDWRTIEVVFSEEGANAGHLDVSAKFWQFRVTEGAAAPAFIQFEAMDELPAPATITELDQGELDAEDDPDMVDDPDGDGIATSGSGLSSPIGGVRIYSRKEWGARSPTCIDRHSPNRITIHHTVGPTNDSMSPQARLRQIQAFHMRVQGWCDVGYNYLVSRDGRIWRGRGAHRLGAHTSNANTGNIGIAFMGTHSSTRITEKQMCRTAKLISGLKRRFGAISLSRSDIKGHRQYGSTECPGSALYGQLDALVRTARNGCN